MAANMAITYLSDLWHNEPSIILLEAISQMMTDRQADDLQVSEEHSEFLDGKNRIHLMQADVQRMIDPTMLRYDQKAWVHQPTEWYKTL